MSEISEKLNRLEQSVCCDAQNTADEIIHNAEDKKKELLKSAEDEYLEEVFKSSQAEIKKIKADYLKNISHLRFEIKQEKFSYRTNLINEMFGSLKQKLIDFTNTQAYHEYLVKSLKKAENTHNITNSSIVSVKRDDMDNAYLKELFGERLVEDRTIEIGGMTIFYPTANLFCDFTLDSALKREKEEFINTFNIQI